MHVSDKGILELCEHEGIVPAPYLDSVGVWTYGVGHTAAAGWPNPQEMPRGMPQDLDEAIGNAIEVFRQDLATYEARVSDAVKVPLDQHQFDALVSFDFNTGGIHRAKLTAAINALDAHASRHFFGWLRPPEIRKRRTAEKNLFDTGDYDANGTEIPVWGTNGGGRLTGVIKTLEGDHILSAMKLADVSPWPEPVLDTISFEVSRHELRNAPMNVMAKIFADLNNALGD